jgi:hypothetical protein
LLYEKNGKIRISINAEAAFINDIVAVSAKVTQKKLKKIDPLSKYRLWNKKGEKWR